ncbi:tetratricopeptide repeat protein [Sphingomonas sp. DC1100-1]|uniref:tetratricopeptide repeat protein n=1 Tax=unclassified Sphingomonas TaxID=196159 RepID=UPI003CF60BEE
MDDDLARQLPDPPPPRPAARRAALDAAMARFDGVEAPTPPRRQPPARAGWRLRPGPAGALASIALVALVGIPMALDHRDVPSEVARHRPKGDARPEQIVADRMAPAPPSAVKAEGTPTPAAPVHRATERQEEAVPPPPPVPAPVSAPVSAFAPAPVPEAVVEPAPPPPPPPPPAPAASMSAPAQTQDVVVTGSRVARRTGVGRYTERASGIAADPADTALRTGLAALEAGDPTAAIGALDRAIALRPDLASAYLNRALAYRQRGDLARAEKDMDRAIRLDRSARAYRLRSDIRAERGDARGAQKDRERADRLEADGAGR